MLAIDKHSDMGAKPLLVVENVPLQARVTGKNIGQRL